MNLIYDFGTEIQMLHCFAANIIKSFYKSIIPEDSESSRRDLAFYSIKTWFKALWDFFSNFWWKSNILGIWTIENVEQVYLVSDPILPASETFNQTFKNMNYCKKTENLHATLDSQLIKYFAQKAPAGLFNDPFY